MTALPATITKKALKTADRNELADYYAHCRAMGNAWIRKQVLEYNRIDILAVVVLGLKVQPFHLALQQFQFRHPDNLQLVFRGAGKCHAKGTLVLMHNGERKAVEDVVVGDKLMGPDSLPRCVLSTHSGYGPLYRITPVKGESFVCNGVHEIPLVGVGQQGHYSGKRRVFTPPEAAAAISKLKNPKDWQWKLEKSQAVEFCGLGSGLPFDPYLFGLWLGDGDAAGTRITNQEPEIRAWIKGWAGKHGYLVNDQPGYVDLSTPGSGPYCPNPFLDFVRSTEDKHIPHAYLVASREDRLRLLAGLLDTDGWYSEHSNYFEISQKRPWLAEQIAFLARSLGFASYVTKTKAKIKSTGFEGDAWTQNIVGNVSDIPTIVSRKRARPQARCKDVSKVGIKRIESVGDGDWHGFEVDRDHLFLRADFTVDHNSTTCTVTRAIFLLLKDPLLRILIASKTAQNAEGFLTEIKNHFENNELLQEIFGAYYDPRKCPKWDNREIIVLPRTVSKEARARNKEASITCVGVEGTIVSKHYDAIISDDLVDEENSRTQYMRDKAKTWYYQTLLPTLEPPESEIEHRGEHHRLGTRYHYADLYGHLIENELKDHHQVIPALDEHGRSPWPEKYPAKWFTKRRRESGIIIFNAQYQCDTEAMKGEIFRYDLCQQVSPEDYPSHKGLRVYMGVDLAISEKDSADKFAIVVIGMVPDRSGYFALDYYEGQLRFKAQTAKIVEYYRRWDPIRCMIETNQYQEAQYQTLKDEYPDIRLKAVKQDKDKITRAWKLSGAFEDGKMYFRKGQHDLLIEHIVLFPNHRYKDLFDAFDLAMRGSRVKRKRSREREPGVI